MLLSCSILLEAASLFAGRRASQQVYETLRSRLAQLDGFEEQVKTTSLLLTRRAAFVGVHPGRIPLTAGEPNDGADRERCDARTGLGQLMTMTRDSRSRFEDGKEKLAADALYMLAEDGSRRSVSGPSPTPLECASANYTRSRTRVPRQGGRGFHARVGTESTGSWAPLN